MAEYQINDFKVRSTSEGEIEITQSHLENNDQVGVFIKPAQINQLVELLEAAARDIKEVLDHGVERSTAHTRAN